MCGWLQYFSFDADVHSSCCVRARVRARWRKVVDRRESIGPTAAAEESRMALTDDWDKMLKVAAAAAVAAQSERLES